MEPKGSIVKKLEEILKERESVEKDENNSSLTQANDFYNKLLDAGVVVKKGYRLRGIEDNHLFQIKLNY